jgi:DNA-binding FrmR family transcriptional regulator
MCFLPLAAMPDEDITLKTVLDHIQGIQRSHRRDIQESEERMTRRLDRMEGRLERIERRIDRMEANLTCQIDAIDKRLDAIEIEKLPQKVKKLEVALGTR